MGSGDLVTGLALAEGFRRAGLEVDFTILSNNEFGSLADGIARFVRVPVEPHLFLVNDRRTRLYREIMRIRPDLLIVFGSWVPVLPYLDEIDSSTVLLLRQCNDPWLSLRLPGGQVVPINPEAYDLALSCEPGFLPPGFSPIEPVVIRNRDEILSRDEARSRLGVPEGKRLCVIARNGYDGELEALLDRHSAPGDEWHVLTMTNRDGSGVFPLADYAAAIDLLISGGGYATFYETRYFGIPAQLEAFDRNAEDIGWRLRENAGYEFDVNGADQFVQMARRVIGHA